MTLANLTNELTCDLVEIFGTDPQGVEVSVGMVDPRLIYPVGGSPAAHETIYPTTLRAVSDDQGIVRFNLLPSSIVGNYRVTVGSFIRIINMPDSDVRLSNLMNAS